MPDKEQKIVITDATVEGETPAGDPVQLTDSTVQGMTAHVASQPSLPPTTTEQEDIVLAGQRKVNLIWEYTQAIIAMVVVTANMLAALFNVYNERAVDVPMILSSSLFLIIGFYFSRTNHQAIGGIGRKVNEEQQYRGR